MGVIYNIKNPPKRKIPKMRVARSHHYVMIFPADLSPAAGYILKGMPYINFFDSFLEDCHKQLYKINPDLATELEGKGNPYTVCLN